MVPRANYGWNLYDAPNDTYSPVWRSTEGQEPGEYQLATSDGGRDYTIFTNGGLSATYIIKNLFITVGTSSGQSLWTADAKGWRFPFWDFVSPANIELGLRGYLLVLLGRAPRAYGIYIRTKNSV